jgi:hypothetical protein
MASPVIATNTVPAFHMGYFSDIEPAPSQQLRGYRGKKVDTYTRTASPSHCVQWFRRAPRGLTSEPCAFTTGTIST